ncbi:MAG: ABC transporter substrate-binding protein [Pseudotabrizicola sp.]|jgi:phospholipid transport system substrate-binding protein|uniref:MlaC/ttg2D family ABC transporter substrate-binding protein n=1 Tax=Pseudotabrizicola sp. TaxID=2939647 RepID=UPI002722E2BA|nr:ABC transporter substrate-binding protein [Pseudotabrizicola sp.]MDO8882452.1 ABC transporter substrate-binding protein [Pseudotabrizicola sp.]MDP2082288.1 ABC transporter substrate-binding protein [Pseudotabrizicola sp.]MDZ7575208.1 ABC transporter substrate-binding protein [Pseudotabrizicola sp.]
MANDRLIITRRGFGIGLVGGAAALAMPLPAAALTVDQARALVGKTIADVNRTINSGKSASAMYADFERIFRSYADVPTIARSALGPAARSASNAQLSAFTTAYQGYIARKYGARFREFIGGQIEVTGARAVKSYFEVISVAKLRGQAPFDLRWHVSDKSGKDLFFNIIIEGVNMLASERTEIGAMLDRRRGDINGLIEDLKKA